MQLGVFDLGPTGACIARRLLSAGVRCVVYDRSPRLVAELAAAMAHGACSLADLANELDSPRMIWLACSNDAVDGALKELLPHLDRDDIIVDCTDSYFVDDMRRAADLAAMGVHYVDVGVTSGVDGPDRGLCLTIGGEAAAVRALDPVFRLLADRSVAAGHSETTAARGYLHCGPAGAGHFVNMVHDGIECGLIAAYAEGFSMLRAANAGLEPSKKYEFNLRAIADVWRHGSSMLASPVLDMTARALANDGAAAGCAGRRAPSRRDWLAIRTAADEAVPIPVLASAMYRPAGDGDKASFSTQLLTAVREARRGRDLCASR
jgi:6-phosphogluconate dehydrogenase